MIFPITSLYLILILVVALIVKGGGDFLKDMIETFRNGFTASIRFTCDNCHYTEQFDNVKSEIRPKMDMGNKGWDISKVHGPKCAKLDIRTGESKTYRKLLKRPAPEGEPLKGNFK